MKINSLKFSLVALSFCMLSAYADEEPTQVNFDTVEVVSQGGSNDVNSYKVSVRNASLLRDILRDIPGVNVGSGSALNQKLYVRGVNDRGVNITIDGARQRGNIFHHNADLLLDPDIIKAVAVDVGVHSVVGNSGALGGSMAFETLDAKDLLMPGEVFGGKVKFGYASNNKEWLQGLNLYGRAFDSLDILAVLNHRGHDFGKDAKNGRLGGDGDATNYLFKIGYDLTDYSNLTLSTERMNYDGMYPLRNEWEAMGDPSDTKNTRDTYAIKYTLNPNDYVDMKFNAYYTDNNLARKSDTRVTDQGVQTTGAKIVNKSKISSGDISNTLVYGAEYYHSRSYNKSAEPRVPADVADSFSLFIEDQIRYAGLTITPGIRMDKYELDTMGGEKGKTGRADYSWTEWSPALALDYQFDMGLGVYGSWAKLFRGPDPIESIRLSETNVLEMVTNDELSPETGDAWEFGTRFKKDISDNQYLSLDAKYFINKYDNLIVEMAKPGNVGTKRMNGGAADVKGVELSARYIIGDLSLGASYSKATTKYKDPDNAAGYGGVLAYSDAGDKYTFNAEYFVSPLNVLLGYNLVAFDRKNTKNSSGTEYKKLGYAVQDLYASWAGSGKYEGLEINVGVYNIFDKYYWNHSQRSAGSMTCPRGKKCPPTPLQPGSINYEPGRNIKASISYKF